MPIGFLLSGVLVLTVGVNGQSGVQSPQADASWKTTTISVGPGERFTLPDGRTGITSRATAQGVEIRIGNSVLVADEAEVANWTGSTGPAEIQLRGNVRLKTVLDVHQKQYSQ
jgi:hypothetical protein